MHPALKVRLHLGVTGHRHDNPLFAARKARIEAVLARILDVVDATLASEAGRTDVQIAPPRLHSLLADGADQLAAEAALQRGWELIAPLPFGLTLTTTIAAQPRDAMEANVLLHGEEDQLHTLNSASRERALRLQQLLPRARLFELGEQDDTITGLLFARLEDPVDERKAQVFDAEVSLRIALANRVMIEQSDFVIAIWDGATRALVGGTGHTIHAALESGASVVWIDADEPEHWRVLASPEALADIRTAAAHVDDSGRIAVLTALVQMALRPAIPRNTEAQHGEQPLSRAVAMSQESWPERSKPIWHLYRRVEAMFGEREWRRRLRNLRLEYETPAAIAGGTAAPVLESARALPGRDEAHVDAVEVNILRRFAYFDGVSAHLSDIYRGSMTANFLLGALAVIGGLAYLPFASSDSKWIFALFELLVLAAILAFTLVGRRSRWHGRWFQTRRVAEYLRHAPILLLVGVARPPGRWPVGAQTSWPEWYARQVLREPGLPRLVLTRAYLRAAAGRLLQVHVTTQRDYHVAKARRLAAVHRNLDRMSEVLFALAVLSVGIYLALKGGGALHWWPVAVAKTPSYLFTFLGVALPTLGGAIAGLRYFGDFERFAAISAVAAGKLGAIDSRLSQLLAAPDSELDYGRVADLAHATDEVVVSEIESWQAVFAGKKVSVPV